MRLGVVAVIAALLLGACATHPGKVGHVARAADGDRPEAITPAGIVRGIEGAGVRAFLGVPYAAPPTGPLRWRPPQPVAAWSGVRGAGKIGSDCTQAISRTAILGGGGGIVFGSEDCLFLNIYRPAAETGPRPVMVYLHGGAFTIGSGANYDPSRLARTQDRVVVTVNFRLGALGWLAHHDFAEDGDGEGGNWGLMDQQAALRWVKSNIGGFGGDPGDITLFAESSGAWSACYLMASPGSEGLFHRVILQSGPCLEPTSLNPVRPAAEAGHAFARSVGCDGPDAVACMRRLPRQTLARAASVRSGLNGPGSWGPVFGDALVPLSPPQAFARGRFTRVPAIVGSNADEGRLFAVEVRDLDRYDAQTRWMYGDQGQAVLDRYPVGPEGPGLAMARSFTDQRFSCPAQALRRLLSKHVTVHGYEFADPDAPMVLPRWLLPYDMGAYHASDLTYVFGERWVLGDPAKFTPDQRALSDRMMRLWAGFGHDPAFEAEWPSIGEDGTPIRIFDPAGDRLDDSFFERRQCAFWDGAAWGAAAP